ncbi:MAG TPA: 2-oxo acid dehydrogenase subunit E2 [Steroidobacteraceae bacterium]|nr:2-oxo acid dehydrogenase subunit E2 [Steroidobacteraceae bacterium]
MNAAADVVEVRVPDLGGFKDVAVIDVMVKPGDRIDVDTPLVTLESDKAAMDVPSTASGVIEKVHTAKGGKVNSGDLLATLKAAGGAQTGAEPPAAAASAAAAAPATPAAPAQPSPLPAPPAQAAPAAAAPVAAAPAAPSKEAAPAPPPAPAASERPAKLVPFSQLGAPTSYRPDLPAIDEPGFTRAHAGPSVRRFARELGVDLARVTGSGFKGRITHQDVKSFVKGALAAPAAPSAPAAAAAAARGAGLPAVPAVDYSQFGPVETQPLTRIQKISGPRLQASWVNIPHVTQFDEADITELEELRASLKDKAQAAGVKLTPLAFIMRACVKTLLEFPRFNSALDADGANLIVRKFIHMGFAADTPNGLVVPVVRDAHRKDVYELARQLAQLSDKARAGKLPPLDMQGGCFTISSLGGIGGTAFTPIINAPEVAILGVSRSSMRPVYRGTTFVPRLMLPLSLSYDHRVIDGAMAARFTTYLAQTLAEPRSLLEAVL